MTMKLIGVIGAALIALTPATAMAQMAPGQHGPGDRPGIGGPGHDGHPRPGPGMNRPGPNYGNWDNRWGARPPVPPRHWSNQGDWYRHVRACQRKFRSYNARTDTYAVRNGRARRCAL